MNRVTEILLLKHERGASSKAGFTLVEILLVVAILGILAGVAVIGVRGRTDKANKSACRASIQAIRTAIDAYDVDNGTYPPSLQSLVARDSAPNWSGPYIQEARMLKDPWGHEFQYSPREDGCEIRSAGPDGQMGSGDDLTN